MESTNTFFKFIFLKGFKHYEIRLLPKPDEKINYQWLNEICLENNIVKVKNSLYPSTEEMYPDLCITLSKKFNVYLGLQPKDLERVKLERANTKDKAILLEHIGIDIDKNDKSNGTSKNDKNILFTAVKEILEEYQIGNYMIVDSGNGFHIWIKLLQTIVLNEKTLPKIERVYKQVLSEMNLKFIPKTNGLFSIDNNARDISRILRVAGTNNYKKNGVKKVVLVEVHIDEKDYRFDKQFKELLEETEEIEPKKTIIRVNKDEIDDIYENPLVKLWYEEDLPDDADKHNKIGYALQSLVHYFGLEKQVQDIEKDINYLHGTNLHLGYCTNPTDLKNIYTIALNWCIKHYPKYISIFRSKIEELDEEL